MTAVDAAQVHVLLALEAASVPVPPLWDPAEVMPTRVDLNVKLRHRSCSGRH